MTTGRDAARTARLARAATEPGAAAHLQVRDAVPEDAAAIAALLDQLGYPASAEAVTRRLRVLMRHESNAVLVAEEGGRAVGLTTGFLRDLIHRDAPFCRIASLVVDEEARGRGVGRLLVERVESWARAHGCSVIEVSSGTHRPGAHRFYERLGYVEKPKRYVKDL